MVGWAPLHWATGEGTFICSVSVEIRRRSRLAEFSRPDSTQKDIANPDYLELVAALILIEASVCAQMHNGNTAKHIAAERGKLMLFLGSWSVTRLICRIHIEPSAIHNARAASREEGSCLALTRLSLPASLNHDLGEKSGERSCLRACGVESLVSIHFTEYISHSFIPLRWNRTTSNNPAIHCSLLARAPHLSLSAYPF
jgi:hypothetical protein